MTTKEEEEVAVEVTEEKKDDGGKHIELNVTDGTSVKEKFGG